MWVAALLAALLSMQPAQAAVFKIATVVPEGSQWMRELRAAATEISDSTKGRAKIKYYGGGVMGNDKKVLRKIRNGQLQGGAFAASGLASKYPNLALYGLPMMFESEAEVDYVRERLDPLLIEGLEKSGLISFGFAGGGFAVPMGSRPINGPDDMVGVKVWVPDGDRISYAAMEAMGLAPVVLPISDVLTGLQTGLLDMVATPPVAALLLQWYTKVEYVTELPIAYTFGTLAVDKRAFARLSADDQAVFREVMTRTYQKLDEINRADNATAKQVLRDDGLKFVVPRQKGLQEWRAEIRATNLKYWKQEGLSEDLLQRLLGTVEEYRANVATTDKSTAAAPVN
ncbi:MAG: TRAP transporter substrate-binding protein DctP [Gammaproteobacteria bacterium]